MLHVTYETTRLEPGRLAKVNEDRCQITVLVEETAPLDDVIPHLNTELERFLANSQWFQLWQNEIISRGTPGLPLRVVYLLDRLEPGGVEIREHKGIVRVHIDPALTVEEFAAAMNPATERFLAGGHWFQLFGGEIIDMSTAETVSEV